MRTGMIAFCLGVTITTFFPRLPPWEPLLVMALPCLGFTCWFRHRDRKLTAGLFLLSGWFLCGLAWHAWWGDLQLQKRLPLTLEGEDILVIGRITSLPEVADRLQQFHFEVQQSSVAFSPRRLLLNYYGDAPLEAGQQWQFRVRLNRPHGFYNPGGFDYEAWLLQQGIHAKGYVRGSSLNRLLDDGGLRLQKLRFELREKLLDATADLAHGNVILALALGDRSGIGTEEWEIYTRTGTNHLVVVSGLHVGFISALAFLLVNRLWRTSAQLCLRLPAQLAGAGAAVAGSLGYSLLAGFSLPTQRAFIMVAVFMLLRFFRRTPPLSFSFLTALTFVLLLNPVAPVAAGFWLSFIAVA
ncbi:MAG: ComEC/Rec2 family competence protein, partial [Pseudohongiellaceae bacterium]